ncbi:MAG: hypothetical protein KBF64_01995 [Anaerolineaceae bacterium]|nr:hypothetical protein [Anaerolineaceae bacterium]
MARQQNHISGAKKPRISAQQKKIRLKQIVMAFIGIVVVLAMVLATVLN